MKKRLNTLLGAIACLMLPSTGAFAQALPMPSNGWNLGNTMEATCGVGCWSPLPTQALINSVAAAGVNTVRIPCAWYYQSDSNGNINSTYMSQVTQLVNWCTAKGLYVIINDHWDNGWLASSNFNTYSPTINSEVQKMWTQVANNFKSFDNHVLFACTNEPNATSAAQTQVLFQYYQTFINTVRGTGGNNTNRWLVLQGPGGCNIDDTYSWVTSMPSDPTPGRLMMEVHDYDPYQFTLMGSDQSWGNMFYFWGSGYHSSTLTSRNATWGEESYLASELDKMVSQFVSKGIPVLMGEGRAEPKGSESDLTGSNVTLNYDSCTYWDKYMHDACNVRGIYCTFWDTSGQIFDWTTGAVKDQTQINALTGRSCVLPPGGGPIASGNHTLTPQNATSSRLDAYGWGTSNNTKVEIWQASGNGNQSWTFSDISGNVYTIKPSYDTALCLDVYGGGSSNGTITELWACGGGSNQEWSAMSDGGNVYEFAPENAIASRLDVSGGSAANGTQVDIWQANGGSNQKWAVN
jgi:aryl-phospho-beta-D-glucosidase BglC (GH1 family)